MFKLGVVYQTELEQLKKIPDYLRELIQQNEGTRIDRVHFASFGDSSLNFEAVYYVLTGDYNRYMDIQQKINLAIVEKFEKEGIEFAYPTQTLLIEKGAGLSLS